MEYARCKMKGVQDIRIMVGLFRNLKVINLKKRLGGDGVCSLVQLWCYAAEQMPKGILGVLPPEVIEYFSGWTGSKGEFVKVLLELRLLEKQGDVFLIHDWEENQPWAYHSDARSDQAKAAIAKRWKKHTRRNTGRITDGNTDSNTPSPIPLPIPLPIPKEQIELIYAEYPRKVARKKALEAIEKALCSVDYEVLMSKVKAFAKACAGKEQKYIPHATTWLNQERWTDEDSPAEIVPEWETKEYWTEDKLREAYGPDYRGQDPAGSGGASVQVGGDVVPVGRGDNSSTTSRAGTADFLGDEDGAH
jgi:hypothetical protein